MPSPVDRLQEAIFRKDAALKQHLRMRGITRKHQFKGASLYMKNEWLKAAWENADPATRPKGGYKPWREGHEPSSESMLRILNQLDE